MKNLLKLTECGQSYWLDNLTRHKITSKELENRVQNQGLRGVTSNPAIFHKAITKSSDYDAEIQQHAAQGLNPKQIYEKLVVKDIQDACGVLRSVYDKTNGLDGYVSLEVSPHLAHSREETQNEVKRLNKEVNRPNCFIKIPGTKECVAAIEEMLYEGININITLLFSVESYKEVAYAYIKALERRVKENKPIDKLASVASFFLSRIDVLVDQLLTHRLTGAKDKMNELSKSLLGQVAIANAKMAYQSFKEIFQGKRWEALVQKGAKVQRPLWASTSTKNPSYSDVMYVDPLIGQNTVNTMPEETIEAFADHGKIECNTVEKDLDKMKEVLSNLSKVNINLKEITDRLIDEGVQKFIEPYDLLLKSIGEKAQKVAKSR